MDNWIGRFRKATPVNGQENVLIPGDPEREMSAYRSMQGIPLNPKVVDDMKVLGNDIGLTV
jgi:LDH2 family malate/lactate/ureidoglycolate dehydrogenase